MLIRKGKLLAFLITAALALLLWAAYEFLWPKHSWENYIDPDEVRLAAILEARETYEVHRNAAPRLLSRLVAAVNGAPKRARQIKLDVEDGVIVFHRSAGSPMLIRYGWQQKGGPILFRDRYRGTSVLYTSRAMRRALGAIRASEECRVKRPTMPSRSLSHITLVANGSRRALPGASPPGRLLAVAINEFLSCVNTSFYALLDNPRRISFYQGEVNPETHLTGTTGALLLLHPPLSMHTSMMFWEREPGPRAEYHEFKTGTILISDALAIKDSYSPEPRRVVGFSSDEKADRFYLFDADVPRTPEQAAAIAEKWNAIIQVIGEALKEPIAPAR